MTDEEWRAIPSWPNYEASSLGRVRSIDRVEPCAQSTSGTRRRAGKLLTQMIDRSGRHVVHLCRDGRKTRRWVHGLVAEAFYGPRPDGLVTRHLNDDRLDNRAANLAHGTVSENWYDALRNGVSGLLTRQDVCKRGHDTTGPNRSAVRSCLACTRAFSALRKGHRHARVSQDVQVVADLYYAEIMESAK